MCITNIITLVIAGISVVFSIVSLVINLQYDRSKYKKDRRSTPSVAIWLDCVDDIDKQLNQVNRWFVDKKNIDELVKDNYCYFCVNSISTSIYNCVAKICIEGIDAENYNFQREFCLGSLGIANRKVIPIRLLSKNKMIFTFKIEYDTSENEHLLYIVKFIYDAEADKNRISHRNDSLYMKKHKPKISAGNIEGCKLLANYNNTSADSYSGHEVKTWLKGRSLNKHN